MRQPDPIDAMLTELHEDLANCTTMVSILLALRRNQRLLIQLLHTMLGDLHAHIEQVLPVIPSEEEEDDGTTT